MKTIYVLLPLGIRSIVVVISGTKYLLINKEC